MAPWHFVSVCVSEETFSLSSSYYSHQGCHFISPICWFVRKISQKLVNRSQWHFMNFLLLKYILYRIVQPWESLCSLSAFWLLLLLFQNFRTLVPSATAYESKYFFLHFFFKQGIRLNVFSSMFYGSLSCQKIFFWVKVKMVISSLKVFLWFLPHFQDIYHSFWVS